jgi:hypothetical protein
LSYIDSKQFELQTGIFSGKNTGKQNFPFFSAQIIPLNFVSRCLLNSLINKLDFGLASSLDFPSGPTIQLKHYGSLFFRLRTKTFSQPNFVDDVVQGPNLNQSVKGGYHTFAPQKRVRV